MNQKANLKQQRRVVATTMLAVVAMFGFSFALVPLYNIICEVTGLNGKTSSRAAELVETATIDEQRTVTVEFVANISADAPWLFAPETRKMKVSPGAFYQTNFIATNTTSQGLVGQAVPSVVPWQAARHFQKIECFCFERQAFKAEEERAMPLAFRVDPELPPEVHTITLSYTFFPLAEELASLEP